jgi:3-oxoacyl-[acyl-carrier-protein] synthase II
VWSKEDWSGTRKDDLNRIVRNRRHHEFVATTKAFATDQKPLIPIGIGSHNVTVISNACVSGAQAVIEAIDWLLDGDCDVASVYAGDTLTQFIIAGFESLRASSSSVARPFDRRRDGLALGAADVSVYLQRTEGSSDLPHILSYGCSNDANHISGPSQDGSGLALAIERALDGIDKSEIRAICAHGTATVYNDAMEARAFHTVFEGSPPPVFGIKGAIGHTLGAAGLIEVIVSALVATEGVIPPTVGFEQGEEDYPLDVVHGSPRNIEPGYVLTTNSGFGGMNTAIVVGPGAP